MADSFSSLLQLVCSCFAFQCIFSQTNSFESLAFPENWEGDVFHDQICPSSNIPPWLDGTLLVQVCAAYGNHNDELGSHVTHMFDAMGAVAALTFANGQVKFSASYYTSKPFNVWNFYHRNMSRSQLAWRPIRSPYNQTAVDNWATVMANDQSVPAHPNFNFWRVQNTVFAVTEIEPVAALFNVSSLNDFRPASFVEDHFGPIEWTLLSLASTEVTDADGSIYVGGTGYNPNKQKMYHIVYKIMPNGAKQVEGFHEYPVYNSTSCTANGTYQGDPNSLAGYIHSVVGTKSYILFPIGSTNINPCKLDPTSRNSRIDINAEIKMGSAAMEFAPDRPVRFLIYDKVQKRFITEKPLETQLFSLFLTNSLNAFDGENGDIYVDMIGYQGVNAYDLLATDQVMKRELNNVGGHVFRFLLNARTVVSQWSNVLQGQFEKPMDFPSVNKNFDGSFFKFAYALTNPYVRGNSIVKVDLTSRKVVNEFAAFKPEVVLREPVFVPRYSNSSDEDEGILLFLAGDVSTNSSSLCILDAKTFGWIGCSLLPVFVPMGFGSRYFTRNELTCDNQCNFVLSNTSSIRNQTSNQAVIGYPNSGYNQTFGLNQNQSSNQVDTGFSGQNNNQMFGGQNQNGNQQTVGWQNQNSMNQSVGFQNGNYNQNQSNNLVDSGFQNQNANQQPFGYQNQTSSFPPFGFQNNRTSNQEVNGFQYPNDNNNNNQSSGFQNTNWNQGPSGFPNQTSNNQIVFGFQNQNHSQQRFEFQNHTSNVLMNHSSIQTSSELQNRSSTYAQVELQKQNASQSYFFSNHSSNQAFGYENQSNNRSGVFGVQNQTDFSGGTPTSFNQNVNGQNTSTTNINEILSGGVYTLSTQPSAFVGYSRVDNITVYPPLNQPETLMTETNSEYGTTTARYNPSVESTIQTGPNPNNNSESGFTLSSLVGMQTTTSQPFSVLQTTTIQPFDGQETSQVPGTDSTVDMNQSSTTSEGPNQFLTTMMVTGTNGSGQATNGSGQIINNSSAVIGINQGRPQPNNPACAVNRFATNEPREVSMWLALLSSSRRVICYFWKPPIDSAGFDLCRSNVTVQPC